MIVVLWLAIACLGGVALILGSLMAIGSLLLLAVPPSKTNLPVDTPFPAWRGRLQLMLMALALTLSGLGVLIWVPFPDPH